MYNLYINTTDSINKGTFEIPFTEKPLYFQRGTKMAFNNALVWNSVYNISSERRNNVIYVFVRSADDSAVGSFEANLPVKTGSATNGFFNTQRPKTDGDVEIDVPSYDNVFVMEGSITENTSTIPVKIYKMILENGQYSIDSLDEAIARRLGIDVDTSTTSNLPLLIEESERHFLISAEPTYNKVRILSDTVTAGSTRVYDIIYPINDPVSIDKSIMHFLGLNKKADNSNLEQIIVSGTGDGVDYTFFSFNKTAGKSTLGFRIAEVNNGLTSVNIRIKGSIINGGYDSKSHESDILQSFQLTAPPGYPQSIEPSNLIYFDILSVDTYIDRLRFSFTDQDGVEIGTNMSENSSIVITIKEPTDN